MFKRLFTIPKTRFAKCHRCYFSRYTLDVYRDGFIATSKIYSLLDGLRLKHLKEFAEKLDHPLYKWR